MSRETVMSKVADKGGVQSLISLEDAEIWAKVEDHCQGVIEEIPNLASYERELDDLKTERDYYTKDELQKVVLWKHSVGKNRVYNVRYLNANTEEAVVECSRKALELARDISINEYIDDEGNVIQQGRRAIQDAINALGKLKGVGPATASAVLTLVRPDAFCYLYDEVIDTFEYQRDYKISNYLRVNSHCIRLAHKLGNGWTSSRVAKTIWIGARYLALNGREAAEALFSSSEGSSPERDDLHDKKLQSLKMPPKSEASEESLGRDADSQQNSGLLMSDPKPDKEVPGRKRASDTSSSGGLLTSSEKMSLELIDQRQSSKRMKSDDD